MKLIDDATVRRLLDPAAAREAVDRALRHFADGQAAVQARVRTVAGPVKLSTMAAVDLGGRVAGAKVYTTIAGRFRFVVLLFDAESGAPLAVLESDAMTEVRTAAVTAVAARALARADADTLAVFGTGIQAGSHVRALAGALPVRQVRVVSRGDARDFQPCLPVRPGGQPGAVEAARCGPAPHVGCADLAFRGFDGGGADSGSLLVRRSRLRRRGSRCGRLRRWWRGG